MKTVDFSQGYLRLVYPESVVVQFLMFGDHGDFCPVRFR